MQYIKISEDIKETIINKFKDYIDTAKLSDKSLHFSVNLDAPTSIPKTTIYIEAAAYLKMMLYVRDTDTEIAWHGTVERNLEKNYYYIKDVFLYPQKLAAATVQTDQEKYNKWMEELDDETYNKLRFQGHSHVNFSTSPSGTDLSYYNDILQVLPSSDYYIFMIMNKTGSMTFFIYDLGKNIIYNTEDININIIYGQNLDIVGMINDQKEKYCEKPVIYVPPATKYPGLWDKWKDDDPYYKNPYLDDEKITDTDRLYSSIDKKYKNAALLLKAKKEKKKWI